MTTIFLFRSAKLHNLMSYSIRISQKPASKQTPAHLIRSPRPSSTSTILPHILCLCLQLFELVSDEPGSNSSTSQPGHPQTDLGTTVGHILMTTARPVSKSCRYVKGTVVKDKHDVKLRDRRDDSYDQA